MQSNRLTALHPADAGVSRSLKQRLAATRNDSLLLAAKLSDEDQVVQAMDDASPTKWHLAHTTWFFEAFVLEPHLTDYRAFDERLHYCFNSYYETAGPRHPRPQRGMLTRPSSAEVRDYRAHVDRGLETLFETYADELPETLAALIELGINHEQQHQELILTDILSLFDQNPLFPAYDPEYFKKPAGADSADDGEWLRQDGGIRQIGTVGEQFHYDNEGPSHAVLLQPFRLNARLVSNGDWLEFMADGGYQTATLWLSDGWGHIRANEWNAPGYWRRLNDGWHQMTLAGLIPIDPQMPVSHVSYYEADAFARWAGKRLPTEFEWEVAVNTHRRSIGDAFDQLWQWTASAYAAYPGYRPAAGAIGEYNGKFMCNQFVLRGSSHATAPGHSRLTYRNFFYPDARWQFTGLRLAEDAT